MSNNSEHTYATDAESARKAISQASGVMAAAGTTALITCECVLLSAVAPFAVGTVVAYGVYKLWGELFD